MNVFSANPTAATVLADGGSFSSYRLQCGLAVVLCSK